MNTKTMQVQLNTRVSVELRVRMEKYLEYMDKPAAKRPESTEAWPSTIVDMIEDALTTFLADHPLQMKKGPRSPKRKVKT